MFQKRKYNRQKSERKRIIRVRKSHKNKKQLPQISQVSKLDPNDSLYIDRHLTSSYSWTTLKSGASKTRPNRLVSLRQLCSVELANNASMITQIHLQTAPWSIWKRVWNEILRLGQDSIQVYREFNMIFGNEPDFQSHSSNGTLKDTMIDMYRIPHARKHRIDIVFSNVFLSDIITFISSFKYVPYVMFDLSMMKLNNEMLFSVFHTEKLMCIDLSNSRIDDNYLIQLSNAISSGKLAHLTIVKLNKCKVTRMGIVSLFELDSCLACIETDISLPITRQIQDNQGYVNNSKWIKLDTNIMPASLVFKLPLALKLCTLIRFYGDLIIAKPEGMSISKDLLRELRQSHVFDLSVSSETYDPDVSRLWNERIKLRNRIYSGYIYILDKNYKELVSPFLQPEAIQEEQTPTQTNSENTTRKRKRTIKADAKSFFCI